MHDRYVFAVDRVRFVGEQVAAELPAMPEPRKSRLSWLRSTIRNCRLCSMSQLLSKETISYSSRAWQVHPCSWFFPQENSNIAHWRKVRTGDIVKGFQEADIVLEDIYTVPRYAHCAIETHALLIIRYSRRLTVWTASQSPFTQRHLFAEALAPLGCLITMSA